MRNLKTIKSKKQKRKQVKKLTHDVTKQFIEYLEKHYELRFNSVLGYTEIRPAGRKTAFTEVDERMRNTLAIKARLDGLNVWDKDVKRYVDSHLIAIYDPVSNFIGRVRGRWDGHDYIGDLADCVPTAACQWKEWFHTWMLGMVAQWMGIDKTHGNSVAPLLISRQGFRKSTFCKSLLPPELQWGYNDNLDISEKRNTLLAMNQSLLINIDEFNSVPQKIQEGFLKNILQLADLKIKRPYGKHSETLSRKASFIATANMADVLTDPSGYRRFIVVELNAPVALPAAINYEQIYAQAVDELENGRRYWFDDAETQAIMENNRPYQRQQTAEALFFDAFALPATEATGIYMTTSAIYTHLRQRFGSQLHLTGLSHFGRILSNIPHLRSRHSVRGTEYLVTSRK